MKKNKSKYLGLTDDFFKEVMISLNDDRAKDVIYKLIRYRILGEETCLKDKVEQTLYCMGAKMIDDWEKDYSQRCGVNSLNQKKRWSKTTNTTKDNASNGEQEK